MSHTILCPYCQTENDADRFYCKSCRTLLNNGQLNDAQVQDWFSVLEYEWAKGTTPELANNEAGTIVANEEMPDWVAEMAPDPSLLETAFAHC